MESPASRPRVLLLDQDLARAARRCAHLTLAGFDVIEVNDHLEALTVLHCQDIDLAMLAVPLDDLLAMDLPSVLRQVSPSAYLPVVVLAEEISEQELCRYLEHGADEILCASVSQAELAARLRSLLRVRLLHEELAASRASLSVALQRERRLMERLRRDNAQLQALAATDPLTEVQNVRSFRDILQHQFNSARRYGHPLSLLMLDMDRFKSINDAFGHPSGDLVLKELAGILNRLVRGADVVARIGGEEFAVILPRADATQARALAQRVRQRVAAHPFVVYGRQITATISAGLATFPSPTAISGPQMLLYLADQALLAAKDGGRDRVVAFADFDEGMKLELVRQYESLGLEQSGDLPIRRRA